VAAFYSRSDALRITQLMVSQEHLRVKTALCHKKTEACILWVMTHNMLALIFWGHSVCTGFHPTDSVKGLTGTEINNEIRQHVPEMVNSLPQLTTSLDLCTPVVTERTPVVHVVSTQSHSHTLYTVMQWSNHTVTMTQLHSDNDTITQWQWHNYTVTMT